MELLSSSRIKDTTFILQSLKRLQFPVRAETLDESRDSSDMSMQAMANSEKLSVKLLVDWENNRVVFAECDMDFVDILFSFLTLPLGTITRLLNKKSPFTCINSLYQSIGSLDADCLETEACKTMLLQPRSAAELQCEDLKVNVNDLNPRVTYRCPNWKLHWLSKADCQVLNSPVPRARCPCGEAISEAYERPRRMLTVAGSGDGVFVKGGSKRFMVTDDLQVTVACTAKILALLKKLKITDDFVLEERDVEVGPDEVLSLLKRSLQSKTPLSEVFLGQKTVVRKDFIEFNGEELWNLEVKLESKIELKLIVKKENGEVLFAEAKEDFINLLFSFLTFPLGSIVRLLDLRSTLPCANNLYRGVESLSESDGDFMIKSEECKAMLMKPKLAPFFGCSNQIPRINEMPAEDVYYNYHGIPVLSCAMNPKLQNSGTDRGGRFVKGPARFMVTRNLEVTPISPTAVINLIKIRFTKTEERLLSLGKAQVLKMLKASLISDDALNYAFSTRQVSKMLKASLISDDALNYAFSTSKRKR